MRIILGPLVLLTLLQAVMALASLTVPVMTDAAAQAFGIEPSFAGLYIALVYLAATLSAPIGGGIIARHGTRRVNQASLLLAAAGLLLALSESAWLLGLGALLIGAGYGPGTPASSHTLSAITPARLRGRAFSIKQTGVTIGGVVAGLLVPLLVGLGGWQLAVAAVAGLCLVWAVLLQPLRHLQDPPHVDLAPAVDGLPILGILRRAIVQPVMLVWGDAGLRSLSLASVGLGGVQWSFTALLVAYLTDSLGFALVAAGMVLSAAQVAGTAGRILWGWVADRFVEPRRLLILLAWAMAACAAAVTLFTPATPGWLVAVVCVLFGGTAVAWNGVFLAEVARLAPPGMAAMATGGALQFTFAGVVVAPALFYSLVGATGGYTAGFATVAVLACLSGATLLVGRRAVPAEAD